jgi:hypothetical protein
VEQLFFTSLRSVLTVGCLRRSVCSGLPFGSVLEFAAA